MPSAEDGWAFETRQIRAGYKADPGWGANVPPIAQSAAFVYPSGEDAAARFMLDAPGHTYTRVNNPSAAALERRIADLEGGVGALALASGQAATTLAVLGVARAGDHVVSSASLYGATYTLFASTLRDLGIAFTFVQDPTDLDEWRAAVRPETRAFFGESIPNPRGDVLDFAGVAGVAHEAGVPLIVDNTIATPYLVRPIEHGADIVVHSATKYLAGHGSAVAGLIVDGGTFDWAAHAGKYPQLTSAEHSGFAGTDFAEKFGRRAFIQRTRSKLAADLGPAIAPFTAFLVLQGSRRCRCGWTGTCRTRRRWRRGWTPTTRCSACTTRDCRPRRGTTCSSATCRGARPRCWRSTSTAAPRPGGGSSRPWSCSTTCRTSATSGRWSCTRRRRRTCR